MTTYNLPGESITELLGNYAVMVVGKNTLLERGMTEQYALATERCAAMQLAITEAMCSAKTDHIAIDYADLTADLEPFDGTASGVLAIIRRNGVKI